MQNGLPDLDRTTARDLLFRMKRIRFIEQMISQHYHEGKMRCPTHLSIGQEGPAAAAGLALQTNDFAISTHRSHAHYLGKMGNARRMIAEIYGKESGCSGGYGGSMHLIDKSVGFMGSTAIVSNSIPVGVGFALTMKLKKTSQIACIFLGDAAVEEGVFSEALNFAIVKQLPVLFVCENNFYSVYSHLRVRQPFERPIHKMVAGFGIQTSIGDGNDALTSYQNLKNIIAEIRQGAGPHFMELTTYRWLEHCGPNFDNHIGYRTEAEFLEWQERDPIARFESQLLGRSFFTAAEIEQVGQDAIDEARDAFVFADASLFPDPAKVFEKNYYVPKRNLTRREREQNADLR